MNIVPLLDAVPVALFAAGVCALGFRAGRHSGRAEIIHALAAADDDLCAVAAKAMCNAGMGGADVWSSGAVDREARIIQARIALADVADRLA